MVFSKEQYLLVSETAHHAMSLAYLCLKVCPLAEGIFISTYCCDNAEVLNMLANESPFYEGTGREEHEVLTIICPKSPTNEGSSIDSQEEEAYHDR